MAAATGTAEGSQTGAGAAKDAAHPPGPAPAAPPLAVSLGDPAGIGPEIIAAAWAVREERGLAPFFVVGGAGVLAAAARSRGLAVPVATIADPAEAAGVFPDALPVLAADDDGPIPGTAIALAADGAGDPAGAGPLDGAWDGAWTPGRPSANGARLAARSLAHAVRLAQAGRAGAVVTAPVAKAELARVGFAFPGQTEFLAHACGLPAEDAVMMLAGPSLRAVPLTVHCALAEVPGRLSRALIERRARIVAAALRRDFGLAAPRIAISALNPHAGEGGAFGTEERDIIAPAIAALRAEGLMVTGPHPADALFTPRARAQYDVALAMYHDQALVPLKALDFDEGVNVTLGLPIVRTSPDHGTAFDIAGRNLADPGAMIAALRMAAGCAAARRGGDG